MTPFRALHLDATGKDAHDCGLGDDWPVVRVDTDHYVTTNRVHASEVGEVLPTESRGLARLIAVALNEAYAKRTLAEWAALLNECQRGEPPPPPRELETCKRCGEKIPNAMHSILRDGGWDSYHPKCAPNLFGDDHG